MSKPILVGYDPSRADHSPVDLGGELARLTGALLVVASVEGGAPILPVSTPQDQVDYAIGQVDPDVLLVCGSRGIRLAAGRAARQRHAPRDRRGALPHDRAPRGVKASLEALLETAPGAGAPA